MTLYVKSRLLMRLFRNRVSSYKVIFKQESEQ